MTYSLHPGYEWAAVGDRLATPCADLCTTLAGHRCRTPVAGNHDRYERIDQLGGR